VAVNACPGVRIPARGMPAGAVDREDTSAVPAAQGQPEAYGIDSRAGFPPHCWRGTAGKKRSTYYRSACIPMCP
jgi:hypothetical protein